MLATICEYICCKICLAMERFSVPLEKHTSGYLFNSDSVYKTLFGDQCGVQNPISFPGSSLVQQSDNNVR